MIKVLKDIDPITLTEDYDVLLVGTNIYNKLANGWQFDVKMKYPKTHEVNLSTKYADEAKIGKYVTVNTTNEPVICLLYINKSYFRPDLNKCFLEYDALEECLYRINIEFKGKNILCPIIGSSQFDGNGDKDRIIGVFEKICTNINVTLCDYKQISLKDRRSDMIKKIVSAKEKAKETKDKTEYFALVQERKKFDEKIKLINKLII